MKKINYPFVHIPKVVFENHDISTSAKLILAYLLSRYSYFEKKYHKEPFFFDCAFQALADLVGKSTDSVRKSYLPELIKAGYIEKRVVCERVGEKWSTREQFHIIKEAFLDSNDK